MRILVTGANGQLGSELRDLLEDNIAFECFFLERKALPLEQTIIIQDILAMYEPDIVIHAGAYTAVDKAETEIELVERVNYLATEEIAQYCALHNAKLIYLSTDYVFDGTSSKALDELAPVSPINAYGWSKWKGEQAVQEYCPEAIIMRTSWVYSSYGHNFVKTMLRLMRERTEISVINDQIGSPTYAKDLAEVIASIIMSDHWFAGIFHYSNEGEISWYDFSIAIRDIMGLSCAIHPIPSSEYPTPARRPHYSLLDKTKIKEVFGLHVPYWKDSLERCLREEGVTE